MTKLINDSNKLAQDASQLRAQKFFKPFGSPSSSHTAI